ncbi:MAG: FAD-binding protein [Firmicutes bacterium]|nr:FAD-binding protein [Bacillota bacterium]
MIYDSVFIEGSMTKIYSLNTVIVGAGIAGLNAAIQLYDHGQKDIAILIDSENGSTSRYARSDAQAYYKLSTCGNDTDSPYRMARSIQSTNSSDGDLALVEAAMSAQCFYRLADLGLPFPKNEYGEYIGNGISGDRTRRSISCGSDTVTQIQRVLENEVQKRGIPVFKGYQVVKLFTDDRHEKVVGLLALNYEGIRERHLRYMLFNCTNIILATGGPGGLFHSEAYPAAHTGCLGIAMEAGAKAVNLTEFQYGICAEGLSLMLNGVYQKAIPRFVAVDNDGRHANEFLFLYFQNPDDLFRIQKMKGDQWAFDAKKVRTDGSSLLDLLIYHEISIKGRRVFIDYRANPYGYKAEDSPAERLKKLSPEAYSALVDLGIDPEKRPIEICTAISHHNGGLSVDYNWESNLLHLFPVGEAAGTHGTFAPAGASINHTQVSGSRAASYIAENYAESPMSIDDFVNCVREGFHQRILMTKDFLAHLQKKEIEEDTISIRTVREAIGKRMDKVCGLFRDASRIEHELKMAKESLTKLSTFFIPHAVLDLSLFYKNYDLLICQIAFLSAMLDYDRSGGKSRGSYLLYDRCGTLPHPKLQEMFRFSVDNSALAGQIQELEYCVEDQSCRILWRAVRPIPKSIE